MLRRTVLVVGFALSASLGAQQAATNDAHTTILRLTERIAAEMARVDGLLMETASPAPEDVAGGGRSAQQTGELLGETSTTQDRVVRGIDALIEELIAHAESACGGGG